MDNDKKKGKSGLISGSFFVTQLSRFSAWLYTAILTGFFGFVFTAYQKVSEGFSSSFIVTKLREFFSDLREHPIGRMKHTIARVYEQSLILTLTRRATAGMLTMHANSVGICGFSYGFLTVIIALLKRYAFHMESDSLTNTLVLGAAVTAVSTLMFFSKKSIAALIYESRTARFLLFDLLGVQMYPIAKAAGEEPRRSFNAALVIGLLLGGVTAFTDAVRIPLAFVLLLVMILVISSPESAIILVCLTLPFLTTMQLVFTMCLIYVSYFLKLLCGRRVFHMRLTDFAALIFMLFLFYGGIHSVDGSSFEKMCVLVAFMLSYFVVKNTLGSPALVRRCVSALIASSVLVSLIGLYQNFFGTMSSIWLDTSVFTAIRGRVVSTFDNPNVLGEYLILIFPLILARMMTAERKNERFVYLVAAGLNAACLVFTWSRGAWLGFLVSLVIFFAVSGKKYLTAGIISLPFLCTALYFSMGTSIIHRFTNLGDTSSNYRFNIWRGVLRMLDEVGLLGIGIGEGAFRLIYPGYALSGIETAPHSHNLFLQILVETGIFSLIAFLAFLFFYGQCSLEFCKNANKNANKTITLGFFAGIAAFLVQGMTDYVWYNYRIYLLFWMLLGLGLAHIRTAKDTEEESPLYQ